MWKAGVFKCYSRMQTPFFPTAPLDPEKRRSNHSVWKQKGTHDIRVSLVMIQEEGR